MSLNDSKNIRFPEKHYVGFQKRKEYVNLGFMTPYGTDSAAKKRMETVDRWAKGNSQVWDRELSKYVPNDPIPSVIYDNGILKGFFLSNPVNHSSSWNSCRDKWRIEDPRGFELEITSGNLEKIMETCTIIKGVIQEECIWARMGAENILVPTNSEIYQLAQNNTTRYNSTLSMNDVKPGDRVELKNGEEYHYIGKFYLISGNSAYYRRDSDCLIDFKISDKSTYVFESVSNKGHFKAIAGPKVASISKGNIFLRDNPEQYINDNIKYLNSYTGYGHIGVSSIKLDVDSYTIEIANNVSSSDATKLGHYYGFTDWTTESVKAFAIRSRHYNNVINYDDVKNDHKFTYCQQKVKTTWSNTYTRPQKTINSVDRFSVVSVIFDTGTSKIIVKI